MSKKILKQAIKKWGKDKQVLVAIEEMSELIKELLKHENRNENNIKYISEEIADVEIMLEQLKMIYECNTSVEISKRLKLNRLESILKDE